ncbi:hypothetical protein FCM35_KLT19030 [Carex littledalei]|uniref:Uncharacterized protein n=1 Tax=Carex littledalei TaxID=544730 RepID=A0A833R759_9POAL|nr:hypothetical protein FCM35_KLT19030 [Carex littledalei]
MKAAGQEIKKSRVTSKRANRTVRVARPVPRFVASPPISGTEVRRLASDLRYRGSSPRLRSPLPRFIASPPISGSSPRAQRKQRRVIAESKRE